MTRKFTPKVLTANDLQRGDVVYWDRNGDWADTFTDSLFLETETLALHVLELAQGQSLQVVNPYLADAVRGADGRPTPVHFREAFRTRGPGNYHHGKQAEL